MKSENHFEKTKDIKSELLIGLDTKQPPRVSVLMPVYKHYKTFRRALVSALEQDCEFRYEVVVVDDDDSFDSSNSVNRKIISDEMHRNPSVVRYFKNRQNLGLCGNWNRCISLARGQHLVYLHDDEYLDRNALATLARIQNVVGNQAAIFPNKNSLTQEGAFKRFPSDERIFGLFRRRDAQPADTLYFLDRTLGNGAGAIFRKDNLVALGGYDPALYPCSDFALHIAYTQSFGAYRMRFAPITSYQGDNLSYEVYDQFADMMAKIRLMFFKDKVRYPRLYEFLCNIKRETSQYGFQVAFSGIEKSKIPAPSIVRRLISKSIGVLVDLRSARIPLF